VLLIHPGALGDLVQALPAFGAVRAGLPDAHLTLVTDAGFAELARAWRLFDAVTTFDAAVAYRGGALARARLLAGLVATLRRARPDAVATFKGASVYALLAAASGARRRAGLARGIGRTVLTHPVAVDPTRHLEDRYLDVVAALGLDPDHRRAAHWPAVGTPVQPALSAGLRPLVSIAPGGARNAKQDTPTKRWPTARYAELVRRLAAAHPRAGFVLLGGRGDRDEVAAVSAALPADRVVDLAGRTDVVTARAAIAACDVYIGNDSGLMHVAATTATPAVVTFGPTDPRVIAPRTPRVCALWDPVPDAPCYDEVRGAHRPCRTPCCIDRLDLARVEAAVAAALARGGAAATRA
jgi:ADP-heptose:LPS heptosyltransferase